MLRTGTRSLVGLILLLLAAILGPFVIWGAWFDSVLSLEGARAWMESLGPWAAAGGVGLLIGDLVLPIPSTVVMSALGWMYGWWWGGCLAAGGSVLAGVVAYGLARGLGRPAACWIAGDEGLKRAQEWFAESGGWLVAASRWLPLLPEAVACLAGLAQMRWRSFLTALLCGSVPLGFVFAGIGHLGHSNPALALGMSAVLPLLLWWLARKRL